MEKPREFVTIVAATIVVVMAALAVAVALVAVATIVFVVYKTVELLINTVVYLTNKAIEMAQAFGKWAMEKMTALKNAVVDFINRVSTWLYSVFKPGANYARENPYFKVDTSKLHNYATRINNVNNRLRQLDSSLRQCFWQVPLWEMWRFAWINMLTSGSPTLNQIKSYLNDSANRLETAENNARSYM